MPTVSARDALRYATDGELLKLYAVLIGGWVLVTFGELTARSSPDADVTVVTLLAALAGALAVFSAIVAIAHKVIAES